MIRSLKKSSDVKSYLRSPLFGKDRFPMTLSMMELVFEDVVNEHVGLPVVLADHAADIGEIADMYTTAAAGAALDVILTCRMRLKANCIGVNVADYMMLKLVEVKYKCR